jgi:hypothetical protein
MKKVIITAALVSSFLAINCYANDLKITQVLIEHIDKMPLPTVSTKSAMCTASANSATGFANQQITVNGYVSYTITNSTTTSQNYWIDEYMCINGLGCTHIRNTATLGSHLSGNGGGVIYTSAMMPKGTYTDQSSIQVTGESTCFVQGSNSVYIN